MTHRTEDETQPAFRPLEWITICAVVGILGLALGLIALVRPTTTTKDQNLAYTQSGTFSYSASAPANSVYGSDGLTTGEPILTKVVGPVHASFDYLLSSESPVAAHGSASLDATVDLGQGLSRTFTVTPAEEFNSGQVKLAGDLPLDAINSYVKTANRDLSNGVDSVTVTLKPQIKVSGAVGGHALKGQTYAPTLPFTLNGSTLTPASQSDGADPSGSGAKASDPLRPSADGSVSYQASEPNTVPLLFLHPRVPASRIAGFGIAALCLLLCLWFSRKLRAGRSPGDRDRIRALYGAHLVSVEGIVAHHGPIVDVASIDDLAGLAKKYESMIMVKAEPDVDVYLLWDNGMLYRYTAFHSSTREHLVAEEVKSGRLPVQRLDHPASAANGSRLPDRGIPVRVGDR